MIPVSENEPRSALLRMEGIDKSFPGVHALKSVDLELHAGEALALVGENGAGKSTLIKILGGAHTCDAGEIRIDGQTVHIESPVAAQKIGVSIIYQEFNLIPDLTVRENIFLGREQTRGGFIDTASETKRGLELLRKIGIQLDLESRCRDLSVAQQQLVEISKALCFDARIIVMDEPSAALTQQEVDNLFRIIRELKAHKLGIIYISHRLEEIFEIADRVMVLRDGQHVGTRPVAETNRKELIEMMVGRPLESEFPPRSVLQGAERLRVENLTREPVVKNVGFAVHAGEILGFSGIIGAGRTETMRLIFGADRADGGDIYINGERVDIQSPRDAIQHRICLLTEDRKGQGLILIHSVRENFGLPNLDRYRRGAFLNHDLERQEFQRYSDRFNIRVADPDQPVLNLSGGNQQKVVLAKWLARNADIVIFDEPTRGIDVGAKYEIYLLMNQLAEEGKAIIMVSSEMPEILGMSDRVVVMHEGEIKGIIEDVANATQEDILSLAIGSTQTEASSNA